MLRLCSSLVPPPDPGLSWREIADMLNARGVTTKKGRAWTWQSVTKNRSMKNAIAEAAADRIAQR